MAYQEKQAWLMLISMVITYALYFTLIAIKESAGPLDLFDILWTLGPLAGTQGIIVMIASAVLYRQHGGKQGIAMDERDRAIAGKSMTVAYYILLAGAIVAGGIMPFSYPATDVVNTTLFMIVLSLIVQSIVVIRGYRRGWHG